jgi:hypothetical protein
MEHLVVLAEHPVVLAEHPVVLAEHLVVLTEHLVVLAEHLVVLIHQFRLVQGSHMVREVVASPILENMIIVPHKKMIFVVVNVHKNQEKKKSGCNK